ncbi:MAG TPA: hypothetical protein VGI81_21080 [Tepidisphaeraceae bacterium]|jgi:hypothetical protein
MRLATVTLYIAAALGVLGCAPREGTEALSGPTESGYLPHTNAEEVAICDDILKKDPTNKYAIINKQFFESQIRSYNAERSEYEKWWSDIGTAKRVQFNDWVRYYILNHWDLGLPKEDAAYKATQIYGDPPVPPLIPSVVDNRTADAYRVIQASHQTAGR